MKSKDIAIVGILLAVGAIPALLPRDAPYTTHAKYDHRILLPRDYPDPATGLRSLWHRDHCGDPVHDDLKFPVSAGEPYQ